MVKKVLLLLFMSTVFLEARSQILISILFGDKLNSEDLEFGLMVSPTLCTITNASAQYRPGLGLGLYFNYKISDRIYFHPEAIPKAAMGAKGIAPYSLGDTSLDHLFSTGSIQRNIKTISLPLLLRYRISGLWFAELGPQADWMLTAKDIFKVTVYDNDLTYEKKISGSISNFDIGFTGGIEYKFSQGISMAASIRYYYGLTDIFKAQNGQQQNSVWTANIYIPIGANKAAAKRAKH